MIAGSVSLGGTAAVGNRKGRRPFSWRELTKTACVTFVVLAMVACAGPASTPSEHDFTITVAGVRDIRFTGTYMVFGLDGTSTSQTVEGVTPTVYQARGTLVSAVFQIQDPNLTGMGVTIAKDGVLVEGARTVAQFGVVSVAAR